MREFRGTEKQAGTAKVGAISKAQKAQRKFSKEKRK